MLIVVSPAKKLDPESARHHDARATTPEFPDQTALLIDILRNMDSFDLAELMKLSMPLADPNMARYQAWQDGDAGSPALWMFRGDVYRGLDADSLTTDDVAFAQRHLRILSGLYGLLRPLDRIQPHRLEMGTHLANPRGSNLYEFWGDRITHALNRAMAESDSDILINLASQEYFKAVHTQQLNGTVITPVFKERRGSGYRIIAIHAKRARGLMSRFIIHNRLREPEQLQSFAIDGYRWNPQLSDTHTITFVRG